MVRCKSLACFLMFLFLSFWLVHVCFAVDKAAADEKLSMADDALASAYFAIVQAEGSDGNVTGLLRRVEVAGGFLADAYNAYRLGDFDAAYSNAQYCIDEVVGIVDEASGLRLEAEDAYESRLYFAVALSSVALSVFFVLSLVCWRFLRRRYFRRVLGMKPEVVKAE